MYENDHISFLRDATMSNALNYCFLSILLHLKEKDHIRKKINSKKIFTCDISIIIILICRKLRSVGPAQQKINLSPPNIMMIVTTRDYETWSTNTYDQG